MCQVKQIVKINWHREFYNILKSINLIRDILPRVFLKHYSPALSASCFSDRLTNQIIAFRFGGKKEKAPRNYWPCWPRTCLRALSTKPATMPLFKLPLPASLTHLGIVKFWSSFENSMGWRIDASLCMLLNRRWAVMDVHPRTIITTIINCYSGYSRFIYNETTDHCYSFPCGARLWRRCGQF